jgi:hypothetical protein
MRCSASKQEQVRRNKPGCVHVSVSVCVRASIAKRSSSVLVWGSRDVRTTAPPHSPLRPAVEKIPSDKDFSPSPPHFPLKDKGLKLHTYPAIRSCILVCISLSPPQSDGLSCPSGPSHRLPGYLMRNCPYLLMMLWADICVWSFQWGMRCKGGRGGGECLGEYIGRGGREGGGGEGRGKENGGIG